MAKNLRAKIPRSDKMVICDRNTQATDSFVQDVGTGSDGDGNVQVVKTPRKVAEQSVSTSHLRPRQRTSSLPNDEPCPIDDLSRGLALRQAPSLIQETYVLANPLNLSCS